MPVEATVRAEISGGHTKVHDMGTAVLPYTNGQAITFTDGTGAGQVDRIWSDTNTLAASATVDHDLAGVLTDVYGTVTTFVRVKAIIVRADAANTNNVVIGAAAATQFVGWFGAATHTVHVRPGGVFMMSAGAADATGWPVSAGSTDFLRVTNGAAGSSVTYHITILGCSA